LLITGLVVLGITGSYIWLFPVFFLTVLVGCFLGAGLIGANLLGGTAFAMLFGAAIGAVASGILFVVCGCILEIVIQRVKSFVRD
jgi:hypothetical protein